MSGRYWPRESMSLATRLGWSAGSTNISFTRPTKLPSESTALAPRTSVACSMGTPHNRQTRDLVPGRYGRGKKKARDRNCSAAGAHKSPSVTADRASPPCFHGPIGRARGLRAGRSSHHAGQWLGVRHGLDFLVPNWTIAPSKKLSKLTSKCCSQLCQAKSARKRGNLSAEQHICRTNAATLAIGDVNAPVGVCAEVGGGEAEAARGAFDRGRRAFEFEEGANGSFVEFGMDSGEFVCGAVLLVLEAGAKPEALELLAQVGVRGEDDFAFEAFFEAQTLRAG